MRPGNLKMTLFAMVFALVLPVTASAVEDARDYSDAERMIFMHQHLANISPPRTLHYTFSRSGSLDESFEDTVTVDLSRDPKGDCCAAHTDFLNGDRKTVLPDIDSARANPVILYFLERDVREMQRRTGGQPNHFRKRIRMAIYEGASVRLALLSFQGQDVPGYEIEISPYEDDPNRPRFEAFADKRYFFMLADAVPGGVYGLRTYIRNVEDGSALIVEEMYIEGAEPRDALARTASLEVQK